MLRVNIKTMGGFRVSVNQDIPNAITAVFGPSGAGKSTMLRAIAGLEPSQGTIRFNEVEWLNTVANVDLKPHRRPVGYVRQSAQLFPHLTVRGNLLFPTRYSTRTEQEISIDAVIEDFELEHLLERKTHQISGGETQRVVLARMLLSQPKLLLLDEPLTGLDMQRKAELLPFLESLHTNYDLPTLYVSHAIDEVTALCSHTIVLDQGCVRVSGPTAEVIERPDLDRLLGEVEASSLVHATVLAHDERYALTTLQVENVVWSVPMHVALQSGERTTLRVRARDVALAKEKPEAISVRNILHGELVDVVDTSVGPSADCIVQSGTTRLRASITRKSLDQLGFRVGDRVYALVKSVTLG